MAEDQSTPKQSTPKKPDDDLSRRSFIKTGAGVAAGIAAASAGAQSSVVKNIFPASVLGANERLHTGHIGTGGMGIRNLQFCTFRKNQDIRPIAVCDLRPEAREQAGYLVQERHPKPTEHERFEEIIENKDVDAVVIVTPDHWHTIPSMMACDAGKDVWCEKPLTTSIAEGQPLIDAVRRNKTVLQCGNFQRSGAHFKEVQRLVSSGYIGKVSRAETWIHDGGKNQNIGNPPDEAPPEGWDWDRYVGWTEKVPYNKNRWVHNFRWFLDYSGGKMTDWGAHLIDIVLWSMGEEKKPKTVMAMGGNYVLDDNRTTPDQLDVLYDFDDYVLSFSNRVYNGYVERNRYGIIFYGSKGTLYTDRMGYFVEPVDGGCEPLKVEDQKEGDMNVAHWDNFVECVKSRKDPICFVESAFNTATVCHMGTTAYKTGGCLGWDPDTHKFTGADTEAVKKANAWAHRPYQNGWMLEAPYNEAWKA